MIASRFILSTEVVSCILLAFVICQTTSHNIFDISAAQEWGVHDDVVPSPNPGFHSRRFLRRHSLLSTKHHLLSCPHAVPPELWFPQYLDHSHPTDDRQWKQRYFVNASFYKPGGPAFLMIGGEGEANAVWMTQGTWMDYAREMGAICFQLEHRFYGKSHPTEDMSVKNLVYLTSEQALADLAYFVTSMNDQFNLTGTKWIAFGGSYPGSLAAWFRLKYPHLVHGAVSTSGPLLAKANFVEYLEVVQKSLEVTDKDCFDAVKEGIKTVTDLVQHEAGWKLLTKDFKLCTPFNASKAEDVSVFLETLVGYFEEVVQYNKDNREFEGVKYTNVTIKTLCDIMTGKGSGYNEKNFNIQTALVNAFMELENSVQRADTKEDLQKVMEKLPQIIRDNVASNAERDSKPYHGLAFINELAMNMTGESCVDFTYQSMIGDMRNVSWESSAGVGGRQWTYQTCTEFGWYQSSDQQNHPWSNYFPESFWETQCADIFGPKYNLDLLRRGIERTNIVYGSKNIKVSNVVFVHGSIDPWHAMGVIKDLSDSATAIFIPGTAHCANMYPERQEDPPQLKRARKMVKQHIEKWLKKPL